MLKAGNNRPVLVTGASRGLGCEISLALAEQGFRVWAGVRGLETAAVTKEAAARKLAISPIELDVTKNASVAGALRRIEETDGTLYGLVNNAGIQARCCFEDFPEDRIREIFEVNLFGTMRVTRTALPLLRRGGGRVVMVGSIAGRIGALGSVPYAASKFALEGFAESLALELGFFDIGVTIVEPGIVKTAFWDGDGILSEAKDPKSPYFKLFWSAEQLTEGVLKSSTLSPGDVAEAVARALTGKRPPLREVVGWRAALAVSLRRHLWGELFEKLYFGGQRKMIRKRMETFVAPEGAKRAE